MEQYANFLASTTLNMPGDVNSSAVTLTLTSIAAPFSTTFPFRIRIDDELMKVTATPGANQWTVVRGDGGSTAAAHTNGSTVKQVLSKEGLEALVSIQYNASEIATRRTLNFANTGLLAEDDSGNNRVNITIAGDFGEVLTKPVVGGFTLDGHSVAGTPTAVQQGKSIYIYHPGTNGDSNVELYVAVPGATPYSVIAKIIPFGLAWAFTSMGMYFGDGTKLHRIVYQFNNSQITNDKYTAWNTFNTAPFGVTSSLFTHAYWFKIRDDGTNKTWHYSPDGINWLQCNSEARNTFLTTTRVGICLNGNTGANNTGRVAGLILQSWQVV